MHLRHVAVRAAKANVLGGEDAVDVFELEALGLRVKDVDDGDPAGIEDSEDDIRLPADVLDCRSRMEERELVICEVR
jgi:hypothetical protein